MNDQPISSQDKYGFAIKNANFYINRCSELQPENESLKDQLTKLHDSLNAEVKENEDLKEMIKNLAMELQVNCACLECKSINNK